MGDALVDTLSKTLATAKGGSGNNEFRTDVVKIRGKTMLVENKIIQIDNISAVDIVTFARTPPLLAMVGLFIGGLMLLPDGWIKLFGLLLLAWCGYIIYNYWQKRLTYGLAIQLNAGPAASMTLLSDDKGVLMNAAITLYHIMNEGGERNTNIYMDHRVDQSVQNTMTIQGNVTGTVTNNVA